ncbi:TPA: hypothetical protein I9094_002899 [Clostridium perfringens]|nr:hypothetical protein [Clostridium perfringens]HAT4346864.1 hypothetical protein [Clostridium perfringens]
MGYNYKSFKEIKNIDTIFFKKTLDEAKFFFENIKETKINFYFPLEKGVLKFKMSDEVTMYYYFENDLLELYTYYNNKYMFHPCFAIKLIFKNGKFKFLVLENSNKINIDNWLSIFINIMSYILLIKDNKNITIKTSRKKRLNNNNENNNIQYKKRSVEYIENEKVVYIASIEEENLNNFKKTYTRHTNAWGVIGFVRHYKNGKTSWVRPHTRGNGNKSKKDYIVK